MPQPFLIRRIICIYLLIIFHTDLLVAQQLKAVYIRENTLTANRHGKLQRIAKIDYRVNLFIKNNKIHSYEEPLYLGQYPDGQIPTPVTETGEQSMLWFSTAPKQFMYTLDFDSLKYSIFMNASPDKMKQKMPEPCEGDRSYYRLIRNFQPWIFLEETKIIDGLTCQRAKLLSPANQPVFDVWFAPEIPIPGCTFGLFDLPGLPVEVNSFGNNSTLKLLEYSTVEEINDTLFWPECFNGPFRFAGNLKPYGQGK